MNQRRIGEERVVTVARLEELISRWEARAKELRFRKDSRADPLETCAAELGAILREFGGTGKDDADGR